MGNREYLLWTDSVCKCEPSRAAFQAPWRRRTGDLVILRLDTTEQISYFDTSAFAAPAPFTFGNSPRSGLRGAPLETTDVTLEKSISLRERVKFDLRGEFYNILNHANFNIPGATFGAADFGSVTSARPGRTVQLAGRVSF